MAILEVPEQLREAFVRDPAGALRRHAALATEAISPFFPDPGAIRAVIDFGRPNPFDDIGMSFAPDFTCKDAYHRYVHVDLSNKHDAAGIAMVHVKGFTHVVETTEDGRSYATFAPVLVCDFFGRVLPQSRPKGEIDPNDFRLIITELRDTRGFPILMVTADQYQSLDFRLRLREQGFYTEQVSIDRTTCGWRVKMDAPNGLEKVPTNGNYAMAMEDLKKVVITRRITLPAYGPDTENYIESECRGLDVNAAKGQVMKANFSTDDLVQSLAGAVFEAVLNERAPTVDIDMKVLQREIDVGMFGGLTGGVREDFDGHPASSGWLDDYGDRE